MVVKLSQLDRLQSMKDGFVTFMLGTHPRLGQCSPVRLLSGLTPVIKIIHDFTRDKSELERKIKEVDDQVHKLLW